MTLMRVFTSFIPAGVVAKYLNGPTSAFALSLLYQRAKKRAAAIKITIDNNQKATFCFIRHLLDLLLSWEHINLTGIYTWNAEHQMPIGYRSFRLPVGLRRVA
ncbi:hypothetical protein [Rhizobium leguminosarum]|uniref:hypothetical protein n=1 Tax=Rhizobium leguminosarum TaxID=384 RepID=UPI003F994315